MSDQKNKQAIKKIPLVFKYRPRVIDDLVLSDRGLKERLKEYSEDLESLPNSLLLVGEAGTGKTTTAKIFASKLEKEKVLVVKGSIDNSVDMVRSRIEPFCRIRPKEKKIVLIDEADYLTTNAQVALRNIIGEEKFMKVSFILTANYKWKIIDPLISRSVVLQFSAPEISELRVHLRAIIQQEAEERGFPELDFQTVEKVVDFLIKIHYPRIRDMLNTLDVIMVDGKFNLKSLFVSGEITDKLYMTLVTATKKPTEKINFTYLLKTISDHVDFPDLFEKLTQFYLKEGYLDKYLSAVEVLTSLHNATYPEHLVVKFIVENYKDQIDYSSKEKYF